MQISTTFADDRKEVDFMRGMLMHFLDTTVSDPQQRKLLVTGNFMQQTLGENLVKRELDLVDPSSNVKATSPAAPQMAGNVQVSVAGPGDATKTHSTRHLKYIIGALGLSLSTTKPLMPMVSARDLNIQPDIFDALRKWTAIKTSRFLWIEGPADIDRPSQNTMTSASLVGVAQRSNASYVAYFGQPIRAKDTDDRDKGSADGLTSIIHTLISQLVNQLPRNISIRYQTMPGTYYLDKSTETPSDKTYVLIATRYHSAQVLIVTERLTDTVEALSNGLCFFVSS